MCLVAIHRSKVFMSPKSTSDGLEGTHDDQADTQDPRPDLLDSEDIAAETGVNIKTVRRWMSSGELRCFRLGRRYVTRRAWFETFLDDRAGQ